jgi:hypothetical protein
MRLVLDVKDEKAAFFLEMLRNFKFVKLDEASIEKASILADLKKAVTEVNRAKRGEIKLRSAQELLDEL